MLDEKFLRKPEFTAGSTVKLGDGQLWTFPKPYLRMSLARNVDGKLSPVAEYTYGSDYADALDSWIETEDSHERLGKMLVLAGNLLLQNYDLDERSLRRLISIDEHTDPEMWPAINEVLLGRSSPKASAVGSE
ncbi:hypothetical protein [Singulisphaera acidiphila]|uniref:hypothetical protein n=1 Tax=Singulisphaera acidiphila TaxID=466153 RepID=UPI0002470A28|nr:hypothetical protein [Singulisphaera acidiphila]